MSVSRRILPVAAFGLTLAATLVFRWESAPSQPRREATAVEISQAGGTKTRRDESSFAAVRALLRDGKIEEAHALLRRLATDDPVAFFRLLAKLPAIPGLEDIIREGAGRLPWKQQAITDLLNGIKTKPWRDLAWASYIAPRVGVLPDEEVYAVGALARESVFMSVMGGLFKDAAEKRPDSFLAFLNTTKSTFFRVAFFEELMKVHPERASELFRSIPDGSYGGGYDKPYILQSRAVAQPTAENLRAVLLERGERGVYDTGSASFLVSSAYPQASAGEKEKMLEFIAAQPPIARNRLLDGIAFSTVFDRNDPITVAEFSKVLGIYTSGHMQEEALKLWLERNKSLLSKDTGWIDTLPSERLKNYAFKLKEQRKAPPTE
jgi:hypothetical protein